MVTERPQMSYQPAAHEWVTAARQLVDHQLEAVEGVHPLDPWSTDSLSSVEKSYLKQSEAARSTEGEVNLMYFLGEGLRRKFEGRWVTIRMQELGLPGDEVAIAIAYGDASDHIDVISNLTTVARTMGSGYFWANYFEGTAAVLAAGR